MSDRNSYYSIACDEFYYLRDADNTKYFNPAATQAQQVAENMIKSVAELVCVDIEKLMYSHNIHVLYDAIRKHGEDYHLDRNALSTLKDYFDTCYPGDNFVEITCKGLIDALQTMLCVVEETERWRSVHNLPTRIGNPDLEFSKVLKQLQEIKESMSSKMDI